MRIDSSFDAVSRGGANVRANWQTVLMHLAANVCILLLMLLFFLALKPSLDSVKPDDLWALARAHPVLIAVAVIGAAVTLVVFLFAQVWVLAGNAATFVAGERANAAPVFEWRGWLEAARAGMWRVIGVYLAIGALSLLGFGIIAGAMMLVAQMGVVACCAMAVLMPLFLFGMLLLTALTAKAIVLGVDDALPVRESLRLAWEDMSGRLALHTGSVLLIFVATAIASIPVSLLAGQAFRVEFGFNVAFPLAPLQLAANLLQQIISAISTAWLFATMAAVTTRQPPPAFVVVAEPEAHP